MELDIVGRSHRNPSRQKVVVVGVSMLPHESPDVLYSSGSPRRTCVIVTTAQVPCMIYFAPTPFPPDDRRGESLVSGNWIGLNSVTASDRAMRGHITRTDNPLVCCVHGASGYCPTSSLFSAMCESGVFYTAAEMPDIIGYTEEPLLVFS